MIELNTKEVCPLCRSLVESDLLRTLKVVDEEEYLVDFKNTQGLENVVVHAKNHGEAFAKAFESLGLGKEWSRAVLRHSTSVSKVRPRGKIENIEGSLKKVLERAIGLAVQGANGRKLEIINGLVEVRGLLDE